jgi:hypothetical protein
VANRYDLADVEYAFIEGFTSGELVDGDEDLKVPAGLVALVLGNPHQTALVVQGTAEELAAWLVRVQTKLDEVVSGEQR